MTDKEIKKALECCIKPTSDCENCPYYKKEECFDMAKRDALNLINRQQAEIERLQKENNQFADLGKMYSEIRAEAIKEFADLSIKRICENVNAPTPSESYVVEKCNQVIDNLVKEMVGDDK